MTTPVINIQKELKAAGLAGKPTAVEEVVGYFVANPVQKHLAVSSVLGMGRSIVVHTIIYPIEAVKTLYQSKATPEKSYEIGKRLFQTEGVLGVYRGLAPKLVSTVTKQAWCWPMITGVPMYLKRHSIDPYAEQGLTGLAIATVDAGVTTPFDRLRILMTTKRDQKLSFKNTFENGWHGFGANWSKLSVSWSVYLVAQKALREHEKARSGTLDLSLSQLTKVSVQVAGIVSVCMAPFDVFNTLRQSKDMKLAEFLSGNVLRKMFRGWPLSATSLVIHSLASTTLIDKLEQFRSN